MFIFRSVERFVGGGQTEDSKDLKDFATIFITSIRSRASNKKHLKIIHINHQKQTKLSFLGRSGLTFCLIATWICQFYMWKYLFMPKLFRSIILRLSYNFLHVFTVLHCKITQHLLFSSITSYIDPLAFWLLNEGSNLDNK